MFSQLLRYPAFYAVIAAGGVAFGAWKAHCRKKMFDPRIGGI